MSKRVPPTTSYELGNPRPNPDPEPEAGVELCGEELARGGTCERPAEDCPYHGERDL